jgi:hypothetical protein
MFGCVISITPVGCFTTLLVEILIPFLLLSVLSLNYMKLYLVVLSNSVQKGYSASGESEMLDSDVNSLGDDSVSDLFVDDDSNGSGVDVEDGSSSTVIILVWHSLVNGAIDDNVDNITVLIGGECLGNMNGSMLFESFSEFMSSSSLISVAVCHGVK